MSFIIEVKTNTGYENDTIHYIKIAKLGRFVCGTYDLITTSSMEEAKKFKTKGKIEAYETLTIKEVLLCQ